MINVTVFPSGIEYQASIRHLKKTDAPTIEFVTKDAHGFSQDQVTLIFRDTAQLAGVINQLIEAYVGLMGDWPTVVIDSVVDTGDCHHLTKEGS